jgi:hypothetical protein
MGGPRRRAALLTAIALLAAAAAAAAADHAVAWQAFERAVRDGRLCRAEGAEAIRRWAQTLAQAFPEEGFDRRLFFPLEGGDPRHIGGRHGEGYRPAGYDFLDGNRHRGHPAQDIFIHDRDRDARDDRTGRPVAVRALAAGVVLSLFADWSPAGEHRHLRGGNTLWIYHPRWKLCAYYAHLGEIRARLGERVAGGEAVAALGRSGANAHPGRSPTHLHLMLLEAASMRPVDPYPFLVEAARRGREGGLVSAIRLRSAAAAAHVDRPDVDHPAVAGDVITVE